MAHVDWAPLVLATGAGFVAGAMFIWSFWEALARKDSD